MGGPYAICDYVPPNWDSSADCVSTSDPGHHENRFNHWLGSEMLKMCNDF